jgi:hypothetical protein
LAPFRSRTEAIDEPVIRRREKITGHPLALIAPVPPIRSRASVITASPRAMFALPRFRKIPASAQTFEREGKHGMGAPAQS